MIDLLNFKSKPPRRVVLRQIASEPLPGMGSVTSPVAPSALVAPAITIEQLSLRGSRPIVTVSKARALCEGCKEPVRAGVRHICLWNAHHHIDTLTAEERTRLIAQLKALGVKDPVPEPPKLKPKRSRRS
jgi:hypothetical protein